MLLALGVITVLAVGAYLLQRRRYRRKQRARRAKLAARWSRLKLVAFDLPLLASYHQAASGGGSSIDDRTWQDLDLDAVFGFLDRTESIVGGQILYHRLRSTTHAPSDLTAFDDLVEVWRRDEVTRLDVQLALGSLAENSTYWLWSLLLEPIEPIARWAVIYPLFALVMASFIVLMPVFPGPCLMAAAFGLVAGAVLRALFVRRLVLVEPFRDMARLLNVAERLGGMQRLPVGVRQRLTAPLPRLAQLRRSAGWLGRAQTGSADLLGLAIEYLNLVFCLDVNAAMIGVRELRRHQQDVHQIFQAVGELDAALSVASVRESGRAWVRPHFVQDDQPAEFADLAHPLLDNAVSNSVTLGPPAGMLVTGANMTGKSTFLRTVGVNVVLAQTMNTVFASGYRAPWLEVASCITPRDDLQAGKSYYQVEVETLVAMLARAPRGGSGERAARRPCTRLYLFDELFRGTNTLDRIGAASAVLAWLVTAQGSSRCLVIAATHDLELVTLVPEYIVVHFGDRLTPEGLQFDYKLRPGPTTTRNAIALLGVLGAPPEVVAEALARSDRLRAAQSG